MRGELSAIVAAVSTAAIAIWMLAAAFERYAYFVGRLNRLEMLLMLIGGLTLIVPEHSSDFIGLGLLLALYLWKFLSRRHKGRIAPSGDAATNPVSGAAPDPLADEKKPHRGAMRRLTATPARRTSAPSLHDAAQMESGRSSVG